ncbi:MAG TPA: branched-chain amino acid ABC transporter permease [Candidatus Limnocylindria bacterium]|jgi:branched-chain amino acid transport system ATP-binding protein|nr:branched-chain amino acid ABC transporter permease [Candidatus Limnocylindria bacterium]
MMKHLRLTNPLLWTALIFIILPFVAGANPFTGTSGFVDIATTMLIFALFASGFNLLFGHVGELSFGHAMFFTLGAYTTALYAHGFQITLFGANVQHGATDNMLVALVLSLAIVLLWAWFLAHLIVSRSSGIYYSMITLAFAQVIYFITFKWGDLTGGEDGLQNIARPSLGPLGSDWLHESYHFYAFAAVVVFVALIGLYAIINSPFGSVLHAIRENKQRARFLGYDVDKYRINAFILSAIFPAIAGWLWTFFQQAINPDAGSIEYSGNVVMMSLLGGMQTFMGPIIGALIYWELQNNVSQLTKYWEAWVGLVFVVFVLVGPRGIMGIFEDIRHYGLGTALQRVLSRRTRVATEMREELPPVDEVPPVPPGAESVHP